MLTLERIAEYVTRIEAGDLPASVRTAAQGCIIDQLGAARAGWISPAALAAREAALPLFASGPASVWFTAERRQAAAAAYMNSVAGSSLDVDDGHRDASGHPGAAIVPAVLAVAEEVGASGLDVLAAVALGYQVGVRIGAARDYTSTEWLSTGRWCAYGVAAATGWLRRLDAPVLSQALAIAGVHQPVLYGSAPVNGNNIKEGIPWATLAGIVAVELAARGFTGPTHLLDHPGDYDGATVLRTLDEGWAIERAYFKPYACCRWIHGAIDALLDLQATHDIRAEEVTRLRVGTFEWSNILENSADPQSIEAAIFSFPYSLAIAACLGRDALLPVAFDLLGRPDLIAFAEKVEIRVDPDIEAKFPAQTAARVTIETPRGTWERTVDYPLGDPANPMDLSQLSDKFRRLTRSLLSPAEQENIVAAVTGLEHTQASTVTTLLAHAAPALVSD